GVVDAEHSVVDEDLDVLTQLVPVPEGSVKLGVARRNPGEHAPDRRAGRQGLVQDTPPRAVAAPELRDPGGDLHGNRRGGAGSAHQDKIYQTMRSLASGARWRLPGRAASARLIVEELVALLLGGPPQSLLRTP